MTEEEWASETFCERKLPLLTVEPDMVARLLSLCIMLPATTLLERCFMPEVCSATVPSAVSSLALDADVALFSS